YHGWNLFKANDRIKNYLNKSLQAVINENFHIGDLDVTIGAIHLKDVNISSKENYYQLQIEDVRFGFSLLNLIKSGFKPEKIPQDVIFVKPLLTIRTVKDKQPSPSPVDSTLSEFTADKYLKRIEDIGFIKRITISRGRIHYIDSTDKKIVLGNDINGWLSTQNVGQATMRLVGKIFHSTNFNLNLSGDLNLKAGRLDLLNIKLKNYQWNKDDAFFLPDNYEISDGIVDGVISLRERTDHIRGFDIDGNVSIQNGVIRLTDKNLSFEDIQINADIANWNCILRNATARFNGSPVEVFGRIDNILAPRLDLELYSSLFDLSRFAQSFTSKPRVQIQGNSTVRFYLTNTFDQPHIAGELESPFIRAGALVFRRARANVSYADSILTIPQLSTNLQGIELNGSGKLNLTKKKPAIQLVVEGNGNLFRSLSPPFQGLKNSATSFSIRGKGQPDSITGNFALNIDNVDAMDSSFQFNGDIVFQKDRLLVRAGSESHSFDGQLSFDFFDKKSPYRINLTGFHHLIQSFDEFQPFKAYFELSESRFALIKQKNGFDISTILGWNGASESIRTMSLTSEITTERRRQRISGKLNIATGDRNYPGEFDLEKTDNVFKSNRFVIERLMLVDGAITMSDDPNFQGRVVFPNSPLEDFSRLFFRNPQTVGSGRLHGKIDFSGSLNHPSVDGTLNLKGLTYHGVGVYDGNFSFIFDSSRFVLRRLEIERNRKRIAHAAGEYLVADDELDFNFQGEKIDFEATLIALFNKSGLLSGAGDAELKIQGSRKKPIISGNINVERGKLSRFYFDRMHLALGSKNDNYPDFKQPMPAEWDSLAGIQLSQIFLSRSGQFEIWGKGFIPFASGNPLELEMKGSGNVLSILPEFTTFFQKTNSSGDWYVRLRGSPENMSISDARLDLNNGYLRLGAVAPEIKEIALSVELEQDGFLNVKHLSGKIKRKPFTFKNLRQVADVDANKLQPFLITGLGLNLGIFSLETSAKGVPLNIPGLMKKKEYGNFTFLGKSSTERFWLAGPVENPHVRGKIVLQNVDFTFPFLGDGKGGDEDDPVVTVLRSIYWDVAALTGKDVHYRRDIPSGIDNVYVDLILDSGVGGLDFQGVLRDGSFGVTGRLESSRGNVEYLNLNFQVLKAGAEFDMDHRKNADVDFDRSTLMPIIYGEARTTVTDSTGFPYYIYLTLLTVDQETGQAQKRGRLGEVVFQLSSENTRLGDTEGEILASLGYSTSNIKEIATDLIGISADNLVFRPLFRPFERQLEQTLGLDMVRFSSRFTRNLIEMNVSEERNFIIDSKLFLLRSTKLMVGKYLADQLFLSYSGQLEAGMDYRYQHEGFGLSHKLGLEYRINPSLLLQMEYDYNSLLRYRREDKKIMLRHSFPF
ncbi:MAG TPA: hypothetical protein ENN22_02430, partial [bacterium]|nr:hypothetical protein [bacterium]